MMKRKVDIRPFIRHYLSDDEFWIHLGIPTKEKFYLEKYGLGENSDVLNKFYDAMVNLIHVEKMLNGEQF